MAGSQERERTSPLPPFERGIATALLACMGLLSVLLWAGCDTGITGSPLDNQPPRTQLSVRDASLVDNIPESERLSSSVFVSWSGSDPDGYVAAFELRFFDEGQQPAPEEGWSRTTRNDSLVLLPIPRGERAANVVFEVRAIDNEGLTDPNPARTVFPIQNAPPSIAFNSFDLPPDTTFGVFSFAWTARDPEGPDNLARIDVSFNDSTNFISLPRDADYVTFVADVDPAIPGQSVVEARVYTGRAFQRTDLRVPGLRLGAENTIYIRAADQTDTTSVRQEFTWYVKRQQSRVLLVNDYRKATAPTVVSQHLDLLKDYLPPGESVDVWDITRPFVTGSTGNVPRSDALPPSTGPTLRQMLASWDFIYWISTNTVNSIGTNNLPVVAGALALFFDQGGRMMVHSPVTQPQSPEDNLGNPAILLLPLSDLFVRPDSLQRLELSVNAAVSPVQPVPGVGAALPPLKSNGFFINELPYFATGANVIPLYEAEYGYLTRTSPARRGSWPGPRTVASISADQRVALFALPLVNEQTGAPFILGADGDPAAPRRAVHLILESLGFPKR